MPFPQTSSPQGGATTTDDDRPSHQPFASVIRLARSSPGVIVWDSALPGSAATPESRVAARELARELEDSSHLALGPQLDLDAGDVAIVSTRQLLPTSGGGLGAATLLLRDPELRRVWGCEDDPASGTQLPDGSHVTLRRLDHDGDFLPRLHESGYDLDPLTLVLTTAAGQAGRQGPHLAAATRLVARPAEATAAPSPQVASRRPDSSGIVVIVPAHNEAGGILDTVASLRRQTLRPDRIIVVSDNSTDLTPSLVTEHRADDVELIRTVNNDARKSGALNAGFRHICVDGRIPGDHIRYIVTMDADTDLEEHFLETAIGIMADNPKVGGISASCLGKPDASSATRWARSVMWFQRVEYGRYSYARMRTNIHTMSGAGSLYRVEALNDLFRHRGCVFDERPSNLVEDYETTLALKDAGWTCTSNEHCVAYTDLMPTLRGLVGQRQRWVRGTIDELRRRGRPDRHTGLSLFQIAFGVISLPWVYFWLASALYAVFSTGHVEPTWLVFIVGVAVWQAWSIRPMGFRSMLVAAALVPELLFGLVRSYWFFTSIGRSVFGTTQSWD